MHLRNLTVLMVVLVLVLGAILAVGAPPAFAEPDVTLVEYASNPVYDPAETADKAYYPCVLYDANQFSGHGASCYYKMWYADGRGQNEAVTYSNDGINWEINAVQTSGIKPSGYHAKVIYIPEGYSATGGTYYYKTWYWDSSLVYTINAMRTADSTDGVAWANDTVIIQDAGAKLVTSTYPDWNNGTYGPVSVHYNPTATNTGANPFDYTFAMYYDGTTGGMESIGLGYSADGNTDWHIYGSAPVLDHGTTGDWDSKYATAGTVIRASDGWRMWYSGGVSGSSEGIGHATSTDGLSWTKDADNPVFSINQGVAWRNNRCYTPSVLYSPTRFDGHGDFCKYKMWFTGEASLTSNRTIGYAASKTDPIPITVTADAQNKTYGAADPGLTYACDTEGVAFEGSPGRADGEDVGTYAINQGDLSAGPNYSITFVEADLTINKKDASVTPDGDSKTYGAPDPALTGDLTGFLPGDNVTASYSRAAGETVGLYVISATLAPTGVLGNYNITYNTADLTIGKADTTVAVTSSDNCVCWILGLFGKKVTFTATVSPVAPGAGVPDGTVTFYSTVCGSKTKVLGTATLDASGKASLSVPIKCLYLFKNSITAKYSGSVNFNGSTSPVMTQWVL